MITDDKLFIGIEAEGYEQGVNTLFVPPNADLTFIPAILEQTGLDRVYFGAGGSGIIPDFRTVESQRILREIIGEERRVIFEISNMKEIKKIPVYFRHQDSVSIVLMIPLAVDDAMDLSDVTDIKFVSNDKVYWTANLEPFEITSITDARYANDTEVNLHELGIE